MKLQIRESFVSHNTRALTFVSWRKLEITSREDLFVSLEELYSYYFCFLERDENIFLLFVVFKERGAKISLFGFLEENSHQESFHLERERNKIIKKNIFILIEAVYG